MMYRVEISEMNDDGQTVNLGGNHMIIEEEYDSQSGLIGAIEGQLDEWEEKLARELEAELNKEKLAAVLGVMNNFLGVHPNDVEWEEEGDKATYIIEVAGAKAEVTVVLQ